MSWLRNLFLGKGERREEDTLYCDYKLCGGVIETTGLIYDKESKRIYHTGGCAVRDRMQNARITGKQFSYDAQYRSSRNALKLLRKGELEQSKRLEDSVK